MIDKMIYYCKNKKPYVVLIDDYLIRSAELCNTSEMDDDQLKNYELPDEDYKWDEISPTPFVGIYHAQTEQEAIQIAAGEHGYDPRILFAKQVTSAPDRNESDEHAIYTHNIAADIVGYFENLLDKKGISVPCADAGEQAERESDPGNGAKLYGSEYSDLLDDVEDILIRILEKQKNGAEVVEDVFE